MKSLQRRINRGHVRIVESVFLNVNGDKKTKVQKRTKRGKWIDS